MYRRGLCLFCVTFLLAVAAVEYDCMLLFAGAAVPPLLWCSCALTARWHGKDTVTGVPPAGVAVVIAFAGFAVAVCGGIFHSRGQFRQYEACRNQVAEGEICLLQGRITVRQERESNCRYILGDCVVQSGQTYAFCGSVLIDVPFQRTSESYGLWSDQKNTDQNFKNKIPKNINFKKKNADGEVGEVICVRGKVRMFSAARNEGNFDEALYYRSQDIAFALEKAEVVQVIRKGTAGQRLRADLLQRIRQVYMDCMEEADAGVLTAMVTGDKTAVDAERKELYQNAGISHFYCISGLHIALIGMAFYTFLRKRGCRYVTAGTGAVAVLLLYQSLIVSGISVRRAVIMFLCGICAKCRGRSYDRPTALAVTAALFVRQNTAILHQAAFLLSFGAITGVIYAGWIVSQKADNEKDRKDSHGSCIGIGSNGNSGSRKRTGNGWWSTIKQSLLFSAAIQLVTLPVMASLFYEIPLYAVFVNLIVLPCMSLLLGLGLAGGVAGMLFLPTGKIILYPCHLILALFGAACRISQKLPGAVFLTGKWDLFQILSWYGILLLAGGIIRQDKKRKNICPVLCASVICCFLAGKVYADSGRGQQTEIVVLDVGQGDGIFIRTADGTNLFIDGGSSDVSGVGNYRILPFLKSRGIRAIDYWFVSHSDSDHISGLQEILEENYTIRCLVVSAQTAEEASDLQKTAETAGTEFIQIGRGESLCGSPQNGKNPWTIRCLAPDKTKTYPDKNAASMALLFESPKISGLFAGDLGMEQEKELIRDTSLPQLTVYKACHHGSNGSNSSELLEKIRPQITVISCGKNNCYGHPGKEAMERILACTGKVFLTPSAGQVKITEDSLEAQVETMLK